VSFTGFSDQIDPDIVITNAPFFPDLNLHEFAESYRIPAAYRETMVTDRLILSMAWANAALSYFRKTHVDAGTASLTDIVVDANEQIGDIHPLEVLYKRAVFCRAKALLLADFATVMRKNDVSTRSKGEVVESEETADRWYEFAADAIAALQGNLTIHAEAL
jgi:hypothetical protein